MPFQSVASIHAESVIALVGLSVALLGTLTNWLLPLKLRALPPPLRPATNVGPFPSVPVFPLPLESAVLVPLLSLKL